MTRKTVSLAAGLVILLAVTAGGIPQAVAAQRANPAAVHCLKLGGKRLSVQTPAGIRSDCLLPNGRRIDEWKLFRRDQKRRS